MEQGLKHFNKLARLESHCSDAVSTKLQRTVDKKLRADKFQGHLTQTLQLNATWSYHACLRTSVIMLGKA